MRRLEVGLGLSGHELHVGGRALRMDPVGGEGGAPPDPSPSTSENQQTFPSEEKWHSLKGPESGGQFEVHKLFLGGFATKQCLP